MVVFVLLFLDVLGVCYFFVFWAFGADCGLILLADLLLNCFGDFFWLGLCCLDLMPLILDLV